MSTLIDLKGSPNPKIIGRAIYSYEVLGSTNIQAKDLAESEAEDGTVVIAKIQSEGKARRNRNWISPEGGLWLSVILRPNIPPQKATLVTLMAANAVDETLSEYGLKAKIKWPNDVLIDGKKVCGILTEAKTKENEIEYLVLGIGINANFDLSELPEDIRGASTTIKNELKRDISQDELLQRLLGHVNKYYEGLLASDFQKIVKTWKEKSDTLGRHVKITTQMESIQGIAQDIDDTGALILKRDDGDIQKLFAGDCVYLRNVE
ncbi:MAG: biotin--[acetyl-CoA-carboxylase] ligase [Thermoplasmata archaeon]|nr:MAG: biotin--[acetyl-CoA-carboxylase] ligase [Thermoplasmata archaeon]